MGRRETGCGITKARGVDTHSVTKDGKYIRFVVGNHMFHPVAQFLHDSPTVFDKPHDCITIRPTALFLKQLRQVPVVKAEPRFDSLGKQTIHQLAVELKTFRIEFAASTRLDPGPCRRESVDSCSEFADQAEVLFPAMVMIACDFSVAAIRNPTLKAGKAVPNTLSTSSLMDSAFNLITGSRYSPMKIIWKCLHEKALKSMNVSYILAGSFSKGLDYLFDSVLGLL